MRVITIVSSLAILAGPAFSQSTSPSGGGSLGSPGPAPLNAPAAKPRSPAPNPLRMEDISNIKGSTVYGSDDKKIGSISTVLMKPESKTIDRFVISEGGVLGVGSHYVALPVDAFSWDTQREAFTIAKTADDLKSMPEWREQLSAVPDSDSSGTSRSSGGGLMGTLPPTSSPASSAPGR
jgi:sporulation protein YlmC with PRC-barrel domain